MLQQLFKILTHPLVVSTIAVLVMVYTIETIDSQKATLLGGFFVVGLLPNALHQLILWWRKRKHRSSYSELGETLPLTEFWYVFTFALLAVVFGSQLIDQPRWMFISMAYAIYHGINLLVVKYFHDISPRTGEVVFWTTALINLNPVYTIGYLLLVPALWFKLEGKKLNLIAFNYSFVIALIAALLTWIS